MRAMDPRLWKFSGVMSACGIIRSNSSSTESMRLTIFRELKPSSLSCCSTGKGSGSRAEGPKRSLTNLISRSSRPSCSEFNQLSDKSKSDHSPAAAQQDGRTAHCTHPATLHNAQKFVQRIPVSVCSIAAITDSGAYCRIMVTVYFRLNSLAVKEIHEYQHSPCARDQAQ